MSTAITSPVELKFKPESPDLTKWSSEELIVRLAAVRDFAISELMAHQKGIEREENKEVISSPELRQQHDTSVELAKAVLSRLESPEYADYAQSISIEKWRSPARQIQTDFKALPRVPQTDFNQTTISLEKLQQMMVACREYLHQQYEPTAIKAEQEENGHLEMTTVERNDITTRQNFCGMAIKFTDDADFFFDWRKAIIDAHRDPSREFNDFI